jgi:DNA-binding IscR family transcriptional regulator
LQISTRYSVAVHILLAVEVFNPTRKVTSDLLASSVRTNPAVIRKIMLLLRDAGLIRIAKGTGGITMLRPAAELSLLDVYRAVEPDKDGRLFRIHPDPEPRCPVGGHIEGLLAGYFAEAQAALEDRLARTSLAALLDDLKRRWEVTPS